MKSASYNFAHGRQLLTLAAYLPRNHTRRERTTDLSMSAGDTGDLDFTQGQQVTSASQARAVLPAPMPRRVLLGKVLTTEP